LFGLISKPARLISCWLEKVNKVQGLPLRPK
jgi:hypothetical protein